MGAAALLALFGVGLMFLSGGDDDAPETEEQPAPDEEEITYLGTDGDDTLSFFENDDVIVVRDGFRQTGEEPNDTPVGNVTSVEFGDGDDYGLSGIYAGAELLGGAGDDILSGSTRSILYGEEGDDSLGIWSYFGQDEEQESFDSAAYGGAGDDFLFSDRGHAEEGTVSLFGDAGDDTLFVRTEVNGDTGGGITKILEGGTGSDAFTINLIDTGSPEEPSVGPADPDVFITDFTPGEDTLTITSYGLGGIGNPTLQSAELSTNDEGITILSMTLTSSGDGAEFTAAISLGNLPGITLDDIDLPYEV